MVAFTNCLIDVHDIPNILEARKIKNKFQQKENAATIAKQKLLNKKRNAPRNPPRSEKKQQAFLVEPHIRGTPPSPRAQNQETSIFESLKVSKFQTLKSLKV